jgi:hypothetical protein
MDQERSGGISSTGIVLIVLACLGLGVLVCAGVIVVCLVAITALGTSANKTFGTVAVRIEVSPEQAGTRFVNELGRGLTQAAWDQTTFEFQARHTKAGGPDQSKYFADFLEQHPGLKNPKSIEVTTAQNPDPSQPTLQAIVTNSAGDKTTLSMKLKKEIGEWKVDDLSVTDESKKQSTGKDKQTPPGGKKD